jgi:hypothetical protein
VNAQVGGGVAVLHEGKVFGHGVCVWVEPPSCGASVTNV